MATIYLNATTGDDSRTYVQAQSSTTPWLTFSKVNTSATSGDTVVVAAGTYTFASITWSKSFTFNAPTATAAGLTAILQQSGNNQTWSINTGVTLNLNNLMWRNLVNSSATIFNNGSTSFLNFTGCIFRNIQISLNNSMVDGSSSGTANTFNTCAFDDIFATNTSTALMRVVPTTMVNCTMDFRTTSPQPLAYLFQNISTGSLKNVIVRNSTGSTFTWNLGTVGITATYSDFYLVTSSPAGTGNITSDPLFRDAANNNLFLKPSSPCRGTGGI